MLIRERGFHLKGIPDVTFFPDDRIANAYHCLPDQPRLSGDSPADPQIRLMLYGTQKTAGFAVTGGVASCTTSLSLRPDQTAAIPRALTQHLGSTEPPRLLQADWTTGHAELQLSPAVFMKGLPSLYGDNACVFQVTLEAGAAAELQSAWNEGLPDAVITYEMRARGYADSFRFSGPLQADASALSKLITRVPLG